MSYFTFYDNVLVTTCHTLKQVKQNATNNQALFSGQPLMLFQMVCSVLLTVLQLKACAADAKVK